VLARSHPALPFASGRRRHSEQLERARDSFPNRTTSAIRPARAAWKTSPSLWHWSMPARASA
jgi:hypothetical protein